MKFIIIFLLCMPVFCQDIYHQPDNRRKFADYLFCTGDYLRAIDEYEWYNDYNYNDTIEYKIILSLSALKKYDLLKERVLKLSEKFVFKEPALGEILKNFIIAGKFEESRDTYSLFKSNNPVLKKLRNFTYLYTGNDSLPSPPYLTIPFDENEKREIAGLYDKKMALPYKDPGLAGFYSVIFPGAGKIYTGDYGDAFFAALATGIFGYLAAANFNADHTFRGILFTGIAGWFYAGNIYGSIAAAQIFNARGNFTFSGMLDEYLKMKNYFFPDYGFCK